MSNGHVKHICIHNDMNHVCICMRRRDHNQNHDLSESWEMPLFILDGENRMVTNFTVGV